MTKQSHMKIPKSLISFKSINTIKKLISSLKLYGINCFSHDITFSKGRIVILVDNPTFLSFYLEHSYPAICTNEQGRVLQPGVYLNKVLQDRYQHCKNIFPLVYSEFSFKHSIHYVEREPDCQHFFSFAFNVSESDFLYFVTNYHYKLSQFIMLYKKLARNIIDDAKNPKNQIILPYPNIKSTEIVNPKESHINSHVALNSEQLHLIHKDSNLPILLSTQQSHCLRLATRGYSTKEIARELTLSHRTVEHYLNHIREILSCRNVKQLISEYVNQIASQ